MPRRPVSLDSSTASLSRIGQRRQVVIPKSVFDELGLEIGDFVEITTNRRRVVMKPKRLVDVDETLTRDEASRVRHGLDQKRLGKTQPWRAVKNELGL